jgi:hypothetical protein
LSRRSKQSWARQIEAHHAHLTVWAEPKPVAPRKSLQPDFGEAADYAAFLEPVSTGLPHILKLSLDRLRLLEQCGRVAHLDLALGKLRARISQADDGTFTLGGSSAAARRACG